MTRTLAVAAAQLGPVARSETRDQVVARLLALLREAAGRGCRLVVFPELTLTTFFPRWLIEDEAELDSFYEGALPGPAAKPLFGAAAELGIGFYLGFAEKVEEAGRSRRFNTSILVDETGRVAGRYRKVHLPGHAEPQPNRCFQHLEKRYFERGNLGVPVFPLITDGKLYFVTSKTGQRICWP